jgi:hypothetical protein
VSQCRKTVGRYRPTNAMQESGEKLGCKGGSTGYVSRAQLCMIVQQ